MSGARAMLENAMKNMKRLLEQSNSNHMCYLVIFVMLFFWAIYFMAKTK